MLYRSVHVCRLGGLVCSRSAAGGVAQRGGGPYTQGKSVNTNLICMEKVTVISCDSEKPLGHARGPSPPSGSPARSWELSTNPDWGAWLWLWGGGGLLFLKGVGGRCLRRWGPGAGL